MTRLDGHLGISDIWAVEVSRPLAMTLVNPLLSFSESRTLVVVVEAEDGSWGLGEAAANHHPAPALRALIEKQFLPAVSGLDVWDSIVVHEALTRAVTLESRGMLASAVGAIDIALWDLRAKVLGVPLYKLLGGADKPIPVYASGGIYSADKGANELATEMRCYVDAGFRMVKLKVGGASQDEDYKRVRATREAVGQGVGIAVDGCYAFTAKEAIQLGDRLRPLGITFFEAPVAAEDLVGQAQVRSALQIPIAGNELASSRFAFWRLMTGGCLDLVQPNVTMCGGISELLRIGALASTLSLPMTLQASSSAVALATSLHLAASLLQVHSVEFHQVHRLLFDRLPDDFFQLENGSVRPPTGIGIGIPFDLEALRSYASCDSSS